MEEKKRTIVIENRNKFISEYLDAYLAMKDIDFAVMISGPWGCGKTHFINQYLNRQRQRLANPDKNLFWYVSLHGVANCAEVDLRLYEAAHPVIGNGNVKLVGHLVRGLVEAGLKIRYQVDAGAVGKVFEASKKLYDNLVKLYDGKNKPSLIVFDDLERSRLDKVILLGYICDLLQAQVPIVILGAENEIDTLVENEKDNNKDSQDNKNETGNNKGADAYRRIREKVIGKTFYLQDELGDIFRSLVGDGVYENAQDLLKSEYVDIVKDLRKGRDDNWQCNYRALKHTFRLLDYILGGLKRHKNVWQNKDFLKSFTRVFIVLGYETQIGNLNQNDFDLGCDIIFNEDSGTNKLFTFLKNHDYGSQLNLLGQPTLLLPLNDLKDIFFGYKSDRKRIAESIASLPLFAQDKIDDWYLFWQWPKLEDDKATEIYNTIVNGLNECKYRNAGEIVHIFTILCALAHEKCIKDTIPTLKKKFKNYIEKLDGNGNLIIPDKWQYLSNDNWGGCAYWHIDSCKEQPSRVFFDYISSLVHQKEALAQSQRKAELFYFFSAHPEQLREELMTTADFKRPILQDVNAKDFFHEFLKTNNAGRIQVRYAFQHRFIERFNPEIFQLEKIFVTDLVKLARRWIKENKTKSDVPSFLVVTQIKGILETSLATFEKKQPSSNQ